MQQAILEHYPDANVEYKFINRGNHEFNDKFFQLFYEELNSIKELFLTNDEYEWLKETQTELKPMYLEYLRNYRFDPSQLTVSFCDDQPTIKINGPWHSTVLWEVPLMSIICECFYKANNLERNSSQFWNEQKRKIIQKNSILETNNCKYAEFGTRRRFSHDLQNEIVGWLKNKRCFVGTSNMYFAKKHGVKAIGTVAHEFFMGISALETLRYANRKTMKRWYQTYNGRLGIVLTDTYGVDDFLKHFNDFNARLFDGVRHDSGDPYAFTDKIINHYKKLGIDPNTKTIVFSDGLNVNTATEIKKYCDGKINCSFGIGTNITNDIDDVDAMNIVIKLSKVDGIDVVKLSDTPSKATGTPEAIAVTMNVFHNKKVALTE